VKVQLRYDLLSTLQLDINSHLLVGKSDPRRRMKMVGLSFGLLRHYKVYIRILNPLFFYSNSKSKLANVNSINNELQMTLIPFSPRLSAL